jgi:cytochrome c-type biogenesis protein CcmH/NrfF
MHLFTLLLWLTPPVVLLLAASVAGIAWMLVQLERREQRRTTGTDQSPHRGAAAMNARRLVRMAARSQR